MISNRKYKNPAAYLVPMEPPPTHKPTISTPPTSDATGQKIQFPGVLYLTLTGLIDSSLSAAGPWAMAGKALSYLLKLGPIIWWVISVPALTPPSPAGAPRRFNLDHCGKLAMSLFKRRDGLDQAIFYLLKAVQMK
ncbi:hypothetical protein DSO57_1016412 [Entomophthora muscae]|uniref:Uncharacterized protein n=1 Tax=Entomophthora muscae TaxID=34485 RepID=A0ACC2RWC2_9FUNG|nr:hypothetical protein DSO57_1016412 [Entomophthora muscae]